ncbi:MAG: TonB-dependent receptor [Candidatus Acidiferrales bacterium]
MFVQLFLPAGLSAQVVGATVSGTVADASGAVAPGVSISVKNVATGTTTNAVTNGVGFYIAPNLPPGSYELTASAAGFTTQVRGGITLTVGEELLLNLTLQVGSATESIRVTAEPPTVDLANATLGGVTSAKTIEEIPLNGRSWTDLAALEPGVHFVQDQPPINAPDRVKRGLGLQLTISGGRPQQNNYLLDGVNINDYANAGPGSILAGNLGTDAVAEFSVLTTNYSTEYGRTSGGVISAITKSGTNQFHGSAYEFARNSAFAARNFFDPATIPPFSRNQYGASAGGPIQKDKTFIFGNYEGVRQSLGQTLTDAVPSADARAGKFLPPGMQVDLAAARFLKAFFPLPNGPVSGDTGQFSFTSTQKTVENFFIVRADHTFSEKDRISTTFMFDKASQSIPDEFHNKLYQNPTRRDVLAIEENHVFTAQLLNSFRVGFNVDNVQSPSGATPINPLTTATSLGFIPGESAGAVSIGPLTGFSGGIITATPFKFDYRSWQAYDNLFYNKGIHFMKFGGNLEWIQANSFAPDSPGGAFTYNSLSDFLTNAAPALFKADSPGSVTPRGVRQWIFGAYFQDDVHLRPNLTFNWGVRYEMASVISEVNGKLSNLRVLNSAPPKPFLGSPFMQNPTKLNFEPRLGIAWDPFKNGKTSVRAGAGIFDLLPLRVEMAPGVDGVFPFQHTLTNVGALQANDFVLGSSAPAGAFADPAVAGSQIFYVLQFNAHRNYVAQWNLNIQRQLAPNTTAMIGYVGSRGVHMWNQSDGANMVLPTRTPQGFLWPCSQPFVPTPTPQGGIVNVCPPSGTGTGTLINPFMGRTQMAYFGGDYFYDGLLAQIKKTMSHGLQIEGSYTWAKSIDTGSGSAASDQYRNSISTLLPFCRQCRRALSDTDIRHDFTANYVWNIPTPASFGRPAKAILGNWEAAGILTMESGTPFTVTIPGDPLGMSNGDPFQFPNRSFGPGCKTAVNPGNPNQYVKLQCFTPPNPSTLKGNEGRNSLIGPGLVDLDFSLSKSIPVTKISEAFKAQFRADFFNIINRANFTSPNDNRAILNPDGTPVPFGGAITLTNTTSRQIQFSVKLSW